MLSEPIRILLAEDNPGHQQLAVRILEGAGARVEIAPDGHSAVAMAAGTRYDLVLMDVQMPGFNGLEAAAAIRAAERTRHEEPVPIVAFSAHSAEGLHERCLEAGMNDCIAKPIVGPALIDAVHKWADRRPAILVADDADEIRQLVSRGLRGAYRVVQAINGREALEAFDRQPFSLVLLDMNMPVLDGFATAAAIRARHDGRQVPIIALTGSEGEETRDRALAAGCTTHLAKPIGVTALLAAINEALPAAARHKDALQAGTPSPNGPADEIHMEIDPMLADLVPGYVRDKRRQMIDLRRMVATRDLDNLKRIAHDIKGTGSAYGIPDVSRLGSALELAGQQADTGRAADVVEELDALLARVQQQMEG